MWADNIFSPEINQTPPKLHNIVEKVRFLQHFKREKEMLENIVLVTLRHFKINCTIIIILCLLSGLLIISNSSFVIHTICCIMDTYCYSEGMDLLNIHN